MLIHFHLEESLTIINPFRDDSLFFPCHPDGNFNLLTIRSAVYHKKMIMKNYNTQEEILIATNSSFLRQELSEHNLSGNSKQSGSAPVDKLEEACWNGLFRNWLPGVGQNAESNKLFLWKIFVANAFLCGELSEAPSEIRGFQSLNPYLFFSSINNN